MTVSTTLVDGGTFCKRVDPAEDAFETHTSRSSISLNGKCLLLAQQYVSSECAAGMVRLGMWWGWADGGKVVEGGLGCEAGV